MIATGSNVRSLSTQPPSLSLRKRSRSQLDPSESTPQKRKEKEKNKEDSQLLLIATINRSIEARTSSVVKAIKILAEEYYKRLDENDFGRATDLLSDEVKASVFITLPEQEMRDKWLERNAGIILLG